MDPYAWSWSAEALVLVPALTAAYLVAASRVPTPTWRKACVVAAAVLVLAVTVTPVETLALHRLLWLHLLQNVVLAEWAPLLVVLGVSPAMAAVVARAGAVRALTRPFVALPLWLGTYALWHVPAVYDAALRHPHSLLHLEHATYLVTGLVMWWPVLQAAPHALTSGGRLLYVSAAFVFSAPLGLVLALVPEPAYAFYVDAPRLWGLSALEDQQLGGITMGAEQAVVFFVVFTWLVLRFFAEQDRLGAELDAAVDPSLPRA